MTPRVIRRTEPYEQVPSDSKCRGQSGLSVTTRLPGQQNLAARNTSLSEASEEIPARRVPSVGTLHMNREDLFVQTGGRYLRTDLRYRQRRFVRVASVTGPGEERLW